MKGILKFRWILLFLAIFLVTLTVGCSSEDDASEEGTGNDSSEGAKEVEGEIAGDLEIQYFVGGYGDSWWKEVIADFQKEYPDVTIIEHAGPNINEEMRSRWVSNDPPDVVYIDGAGSSETQMVEDGQLMNLTDWVEGIELENGDKLVESFIVDPGKFDGEIYSLPLVFDTWGTWYDRALFEEKGYEVPTDFDSFMNAMAEIKKGEGIDPFVTSGQHPYYFLRGMLYPAFGAAGGDELLADLITGKEGAWTSDIVLETMKKVEKMQQEGMFDSGLGALNHTQSQMNFLLHKNAFIPVGFWLPNEMANDIPKGFDFGFIPSPMQDVGEPFAIVPDLRPLAIAENAENPKAAKAFVEFAFTREYAMSFSEHTGAIMNLTGVDLTANDKIPSYLTEANAMINDPEQVQIYEKPHPMSADLETPIGNALMSLMLGNMTAEEFVKEAEKAAENYRNSN
ncbi:extracellular solute-binding protein [Virgibacillus sp. AGTR]|uniref:ABC transporter substrate-binding protein n=1 Tax=unclassified Virgibacillus TaxID=2620237 RepID=UPI0019634EBF|nr:MULTISPECIES: extracellular solute-binding protein [unclassified Virgibacillus]MCC2252377.1 extracellular solute-binding protein [Virgibacillus sp. AGTR]MDY7042806.1 extracellular solute-binding protein [Virgibacillus sp. M23]QRZ18095.1 extracellular solute-binding protein [Virgibacillus sp. AGTR]